MADVHHAPRKPDDVPFSEAQPLRVDLTDQFAVRCVIVFVYSVIFTVGVCGNALVIHVVLWRKHMRTVTNMFITNLAISDIMMCIWSIPFTPLSAWLSNWMFGDALCRVLPMLLMIFVYVSTYTSLAIAIDRYRVIVHPFQPKLTVSKALCIMLLIWVLSAVVSLPMAVFHRLIDGSANATALANASVELNDSAAESGGDFDCEEKWPDEIYKKIFSISSLVMQYVVPGLLIGLCYLFIFRSLDQTAKRSTVKKHDEQELKRKRRTNKMLILVVTIFILLWLPFNLVVLAGDYSPDFAAWPYYTIIFFAVHEIAVSSTIYNPFLYGFMNDNFRREFQSVLPCLFALRRADIRRAATVHTDQTGANGCDECVPLNNQA